MPLVIELRVVDEAGIVDSVVIKGISARQCVYQLVRERRISAATLLIFLRISQT